MIWHSFVVYTKVNEHRKQKDVSTVVFAFLPGKTPNKNIKIRSCQETSTGKASPEKEDLS